MKNADQSAHRSLTTSTSENKTSLITLTAALLCGVVIPMAAQTASVASVAADQGFTIAPNVTTPIVLKTKPGAVCDLHAAGIADKQHTLRFYANDEGYLKIHARATQESDDGSSMQLDCAENGAVTRYPLHVRAGEAVTENMPAPRTKMPIPKGSRIVPGLTEAEAKQLSDDEVIDRGYPIRPDVATDGDKYAQWLESISRPMTLVPAHSVTRTDVIHQTYGEEAGVTGNGNWSGFVANHGARTYSAVSGCWNMPEIIYAEKNHNTSSAFWIGLDGYYLNDLEQAGTEQDTIDVGGVYYVNYYAWTEVLPGEPEQPVDLSPNPGDRMCVEVWISTGSGAPNANGPLAAFRIDDVTQDQGTGSIYSSLTSYYNGNTAEWIMERTCLAVEGNTCTQYAELSDYNYAIMLGASALNNKGSWPVYGSIANVNLWMYNEFINGDDNNVLSEAVPYGADASTDIYYEWSNFH